MSKAKNISVERMGELFIAYKKDAKENPFLQHDFVGKNGDDVQRKRERCLTMEGFECFVYEQGLNTELAHYFSNYQNAYVDYLTICSRIRMEIRRDQIEGGMAGIYNPSITQRLNGLVDKKETQLNIEQPLFPKEEN